SVCHNARERLEHRGDRPDPLYRLHLLLPDCGSCTSRRDDRCDRTDVAASSRRAKAEDLASERQNTRHGDRNGRLETGRGGCAMSVGLGPYLAVGAVLFTIGVLGIFLNRKNVIIILMSIELILLAVNLNFVAFAAFLGDLVGQIFALFILTVAAAEAAIGLAILVVYFRNRGTIAVEDVSLMKG